MARKPGGAPLATATATKAKRKAKPTPADAAAAEAATVYEIAKRELTAHESAKKKAKATLLEWLDGEPSKSLPGGRIVNQASVDYAEADIHRAAYTSTTVTIQHPLPPR